MVDPFSVVAVAAGAINVMGSVSVLKIKGEVKGIQRILSETEILSAMSLESASMLNSLASHPPRSAEVALRQCENSIIHLDKIINKRLLLKPGKIALIIRNINDKIIKSDKEESLDELRVSAGLLRQVAAE